MLTRIDLRGHDGDLADTLPRPAPPGPPPRGPGRGAVLFPAAEKAAISSTWRPNLAPKNDDTTLPYELVITDIMIRPGAMYCM